MSASPSWSARHSSAQSARSVSPVVGSVLATSLLLAGGFLLAVQRSTAPPPATRGHHQRPDACCTSDSSHWSVRNSRHRPVLRQHAGLRHGVRRRTRYAGSLAGPLYSITSLVESVRRTRRTAQGVGGCSADAISSSSCWLTHHLSARCSRCTPAWLRPSRWLSPAWRSRRSRRCRPCWPSRRSSPPSSRQAFTWLNSGGAAGIALGAAFAGRVVDATRPRTTASL